MRLPSGVGLAALLLTVGLVALLFTVGLVALLFTVGLVARLVTVGLVAQDAGAGFQPAAVQTPSAGGRAQGYEGFFCTSHENQRTLERRTGLDSAVAGRFPSAADGLWMSLSLSWS